MLESLKAHKAGLKKKTKSIKGTKKPAWKKKLSPAMVPHSCAQKAWSHRKLGMTPQKAGTIKLDVGRPPQKAGGWGGYHPQKAGGPSKHHLINVSGPFLLTHLLLDKLKASAPSRIINNTALAYQLASIDFEDIQAEKKEFISGEVYGQSKLANMLFTRKLAKELEGEKLYCKACLYHYHVGLWFPFCI